MKFQIEVYLHTDFLPEEKKVGVVGDTLGLAMEQVIESTFGEAAIVAHLYLDLPEPCQDASDFTQMHDRGGKKAWVATTLAKVGHERPLRGVAFITELG